MRWWLAGAFVSIAVLTATLIATVSTRQVGRDITANARNIAIGEAVSAGFTLERAIPNNRLPQETQAAGRQDGLALFVFARDETLIAQSTLPGIRWQNVPGGETALARALAGRRFANSFNGEQATVVALPLRRTQVAAALVAYAPSARAYGASLTIFRNEVVRVSVWAALAAAVLGLFSATLVSRRLRRIARAAAGIEQGGFDIELRPGFQDEIGSLASTVDRMRERLGGAFQQIEAERDRLGLLLDRLHEGVMAVDRTLTVQFANAGVRRLFPEGLEPGAPLPETFAELPLRAFATGLFALGAPVSEARSDTGAGATISLVGIPAAGTGLAVLVLADITEHERRQRAEREFVTNASHELRTPVSAIAGAVEALELGASDDPEARAGFIRLIGRQATRLTRLTNSLLILARAQTREEGMQLVPVELEPLIEEIAASSELLDRVRVECEPGLSVTAQPDVLEQVVANLVSNALKHAPTGEVVVRAARAAGNAGNAVIEVSDSGPGISAELRERIFDRFYAGGGGSRDGFGLGLAIARDSTTAMGGRLELSSAPGLGTTARVILPLS